MKLDLSKFKKIKSDKHTTTLQHEDGHKFVVAHSALPPKMRGELVRMPAHMADGEDVPAQDTSADSSPSDSSADSSQSDSSSAELQGNQGQPQPQAPVNINIGTPQPAQAQQQPPQQPNQTPPSQAPVDPGLARKRQLYNMRVGTNYPATDPMGNPDPTAQLARSFDNNGAAPEQFDSASWNQAEQDYNSEQQRKLADNQNQIKSVAAENAVRQRAGVPPMPVPPGAQPDVPPPPPGVPQPPAVAGQGGAGGQDIFGNEAMSKAYSQGVGEQKAGIMGEAKAQAALGAAQANMLGKQISQQQQIANNYQKHYDELDTERKNALQDLQNQHIDPSHYLNSMGTGQKIRTAIGLILGGIGGAMTHGQNPALSMLQRQIDNDIEAQKAEMNKKANLLSANMRQFGNLRDATDMTRVMQSDIVSNQLKQAAAQAQDPIAKSRALQAAGALDMQTAPIMSQIAMRRSLLSGMEQGQVDPSMVIRAVVPPGQQDAANKQLQEAQNVIRARDNLLGSFDKLTQVNTVGNRIFSPLQTSKQASAIRDPLIAALSKETAGRFTEQDAQMVGALFPAPGDSPQTIATKRNQMNKLISEKMNFPLLNGYGIHPERMGRFGGGGEQKIQMGAPVVANNR